MAMLPASTVDSPVRDTGKTDVNRDVGACKSCFFRSFWRKRSCWLPDTSFENIVTSRLRITVTPKCAGRTWYGKVYRISRILNSLWHWVDKSIFCSRSSFLIISVRIWICTCSARNLASTKYLECTRINDFELCGCVLEFLTGTKRDLNWIQI